MMLEPTEDLCACCLGAIEMDVDLRAASQVGVTIWAMPQVVAEVVERWPGFLRYAIERGGQSGFQVPAHEAAGFMRTLARAVMN